MPISRKDFHARFVAAPWRSEAEVEAFVADADSLATTDVVRLLDVVLAGGGTADQNRLRIAAFESVAAAANDKALFAAFVRALKPAGRELRAALVRLLPSVNNVAEHGALVALLRADEAGLRKDVAQVISRVGGRSAFDLIGQLVREPRFAGRLEAMEAAMALAPQHAVPTLVAVLEVGVEAERLRAIELLAACGAHARAAEAARDALAQASHDASEAVAARAVGEFAAVADEDRYFEHAVPLAGTRGPVVARAVLANLERFPSSRSVEVLRRGLQTGPNVVRFAALDALEAIATNDVLEPLVEALGHRQVAVRTRAGEALVRLGRKGAVDLARTVIWLLRSRNVELRRMAVELVQTVTDPDGTLWPKLLAFLRDEDWWVRERVMDALVEMAGDSLLRHLVTFLNDPSDLVRRFGVDALLRLRSPGSMGSLVRTAHTDPDWWVRERAVEALGAIGDARAVPHLLHLMQTADLRVACAGALAALRAESAAPQVAALLDCEDADVQLAGLRALKVLGGPAQAADVAPLARDPRPDVRSLARELGVRWGQREPATSAADQGLPLLDQLLIAVAQLGADDLILAPGRRPLTKRMGRTDPLAAAPLAPEKMRRLLAPHLSLEQIESLDAGHEVDFSYRVETEGLRFRANVFRQLGGLGAVFRIIRSQLPSLESLGVPDVVGGLAAAHSGLVLVGGATGSGKSTTLAALVDRINRTSRRHIVTLEDPIEVVHARHSSLVNQREVGTHTASFAAALRATLRQDPDVILVGELRDLPTISFAVTAAETGHLVFGTIHTVSAAGSVDRLINAFPATQQDHVRSLLAGSLRAVVCQYLLPRADGNGRVLVAEVMLNNDAVANLIRKGKTFQIPSVITTSRELGMQLMDVELLRLARQGVISADEAYSRAVVKKDFEAMVQAPPAVPGQA
ncbi:MAG: PilT/PilU family type 4a pilus ATPase [Vicinamibacteria bacterium]|jgi:twitching motility protein PilT|nr:PilT/PilU family type 4a pilus ATPase [Vicinamibacteria bacterium]